MIKTKLFAVFLLLLFFFGSTIGLAQEGSSHVTSHPTGPDNTSNTGQNSSHAPPGLSFNTGIAKAREIVASKTQFKMLANSSNPSYLWGDKNYTIQNSLVLVGVVEYNDTNHNNQYESTELIQSLNLEKYVTWNFTQEKVTETDLTFSLLSNNISQTNFEQTQLNFTQNINANNNFIKFDIQITNWPWISTNNRLGVIFDFVLMNSSTSSDTSSGFLLQQKNTLNDSFINNGLFASNGNNQTIGYFLSSANAYKNLNKEQISVKNQFIVDSFNNKARIILNYPYFGSLLFHDPIIGSNGDTFFSEIYSLLIEKPGLIAITSVLSTVSLIAIFLMRRRRN